MLHLLVMLEGGGSGEGVATGCAGVSAVGPVDDHVLPQVSGAGKPPVTQGAGMRHLSPTGGSGNTSQGA